MHAHQPADLIWEAGDVPASARHADAYFSREDGLGEARHVFLDGNDLPARFRPGFHIAELGTGTGLNLLAALALWRRAGPPAVLCYTGFEAMPLPAEAILRAVSPFPGMAALARPLIAVLSGRRAHLALPDLDLRVIRGDARLTLPGWAGRADAWFLDGFSPDRNPELWEPALLAEVAHHAAPGATLATYTAAGHVRRALAAAGFIAERRAGFGRKRHMTAARLPA